MQPLNAIAMGCSGSKGAKEPKESGSTPTVALTKADASQFKTPVQRLGVSGGTAPFFKLVLQNPIERSAEHYIGKDLSRARDEVAFYEGIMLLKKGNDPCIACLHEHMMEYAGILTAHEEGAASDAKALDLLVLRNLRDGCRNLRLLDIKVGEKTADAGWQGKSRLAALRQGVVDTFTNSVQEGYRLEGFDGPPKAVSAMDPLLDVWTGDIIKAKKARRVMYQRWKAHEVIMHFLDNHVDVSEYSHEQISRAEIQEIVLHEVCVRLCRLARECARVKVPQKWIGSSVALGFDSGLVPSRSEAEQQLRGTVSVCIFDWGRSELNTAANHAKLSAADQEDRSKFWQYYKGGIERLAWEASRAYYLRFGAKEGLRELRVTVYDFDAITDIDFIGRAVLSLEARPEERTVPFVGKSGAPVQGGKGPSTLTYVLELRELPDGARLTAVWTMRLLRATNLPALDVGSESDPFVKIEASYGDGQRFEQQSSVIGNTTNPEWQECFEVAVRATDTDRCRQFTGLKQASLASIFPALDATDDTIEAAVNEWKKAMQEV